MLHSLEEALAEVQRTDTKVQSTLAIKKQNLQSEEKKQKELVKAMEEVSNGNALKLYAIFSPHTIKYIHDKLMFENV